MSLEKRLSEVEASIKVIAQYVREQSEKIESELGSLKGTEPLYDAKPEIEQLKSSIESLRSSPSAPVSLDGDRVRKSIQILRNEFDTFRNDTSPKLQYIDKKTDKLKEIVDGSIGSSDLEDLKRHVGSMDKKMQDTLALKEELDDIEETLTKMKAIANKLKDFDAASYREEFDRHMGQILEKAHELETADIHKLSQLADQLKDTEIHDIKNLASKLKHLENLEAGDAKKLIEMMDQLKGTELHDIRSLAKHVKESKDAMEDEAVNRMSMEKRIAEMEAKVGQIKNLETNDIKQLNAALEHIQGIEMEELKSIASTVREAKEALEEESVNRLSTERRLAGMEAKVNKASEIASHIENVEGLDIQKLSNRINDIESNMKLNTVKLLTQQLNEFAKSMDRRIPNIVSREEYTRQVADLNQRVRTVEAPDLSPLGARVERLEKKIEEVVSMMRPMYDPVPIVVE